MFFKLPFAVSFSDLFITIQYAYFVNHLERYRILSYIIRIAMYIYIYIYRCNYA